MSPAHDSRAPLLLCEDDPHDLFFAQRLLKRLDLAHPVVTANDGEEAVQRLKDSITTRQLPCLVLLDLRMPRRTGYEVLEWAMAQPDLVRVPFIIMSGSGLEQDMKRSTELGAKAFLTKYPTPEQLGATLRRYGVACGGN